MEAKFLHSFFKKSTFSTEYIWRQFEFCHSSVYNNLMTYSFFREASSWNRIFSVIIGPCLKGNTCHVWKPNFPYFMLLQILVAEVPTFSVSAAVFHQCFTFWWIQLHAYKTVVKWHLAFLEETNFLFLYTQSCSW